MLSKYGMSREMEKMNEIMIIKSNQNLSDPK